MQIYDDAHFPDLSDIPCRRCDTTGSLVLEKRLTARPPESQSLAGVQLKLTASEELWMRCTACGAECKGKRSTTSR